MFKLYIEESNGVEVLVGVINSLDEAIAEGDTYEGYEFSIYK